MSGLFGELKRRNVFKVAIAYLVAAWLVAQIVIAVESPLHLPGWVDTLVIVLLIVGFPFALIVSWSFERSPEGLKRSGKDEADEESESDTKAQATETPAADEGRPSIAVLPFVDMSPEKDQEYFSDGIAEELLNQLAKVPDLHVAGRTSSFSFKGKDEDLRLIGQKLDVAHILEGSVRKAGNRVRVTAQLIKAADGYHLWSESYDRELDDIFAIQDEISRAVTDALSITLGVGELKVGTRNVAAYDTYLAGRARYHAGGPEDWLAAVTMLKKATELDPGFLDAHVMLAIAANNLMNALAREDSREPDRFMDSAVEQAIAIAPDAPGVLCARGLRQTSRNHLLEGGRLLEEAYRTAPNDSVVLQSWSNFLGEVGRIRESLVVMRQWVRVEPLYVQPAYILGLAYETAGELDKASEQYRIAGQLEGDPNAFAGPELVVALTRRDRPAIEAGLEKVLKNDLGVAGHQALTSAMQTHLDDPEAALAELRRFLKGSSNLGSLMISVIAVWASWFGDDELALEAYQAILGMHTQLIRTVMWRPIHRKMHQLPGFKDLLRDMGLVEYWRETGHWGDYVRPLGEDDFECI